MGDISEILKDTSQRISTPRLCEEALRVAEVLMCHLAAIHSGDWP